MKPPIELAKQYAHELGWKIFPANPINKRPLISGWQDNASSDLHTIGHFFSKWPNAMIGIPTGKINGITVVDIDIGENKNGFNSIEKLGLQRLSIYPAVRTPSGGLHLYISTRNKYFQSSAGRVAPGIDIRSQGGYAIGAGSISSKGQYEWLCKLDKVKNNQRPMIHELRELLDVKISRQHHYPTTVARELLNPVSEGARNTEITRRCGFLLKKYPPETVFEMMLHINKKCFDPPLPYREVQDVFKSIRKREGV